MTSDLENDVTAALRFRADEVPDTPCPALGMTAIAPRRRRSWLVPMVAAAAAVVGLAGAAVALLPGTEGTGSTDNGVSAAAPGEVYYSRTISVQPGSDKFIETELWQGQGRGDAWKQHAVGGPLKDGRVVPDDSVKIDYREQGVCYPAEKATEEQCTAPGGWFNPTSDFLATAPRDPATITQQLRAAAIAEEDKRTAPGGGFSRTDDTYSDANLNYLELNYLRGVLATNGLPDDLEAALKQVITSMPDIEVVENMKNAVGQTGTGYGFRDQKNELLAVVFDADGRYIGGPTEAVVRGMAPALGEAPSKLFD